MELYDGSGSNGTLLETVGLSAGASSNNRYMHSELPFDGSLYLSVVAGAVKGLVTVRYLGPGEPHLPVFVAITLDDIAELEGTTLPAIVSAASGAAPGAAPTG